MTARDPVEPTEAELQQAREAIDGRDALQPFSSLVRERAIANRLRAELAALRAERKGT